MSRRGEKDESSKRLSSDEAGFKPTMVVYDITTPLFLSATFGQYRSLLCRLNKSTGGASRG